MDKNTIKKRLKQESQVAYVTKINHDGEEYIKAIKNEKDEIYFVYFKINGDDIKSVTDIELIDYFNKTFGGEAKSILY